jgi:hypothetical protein
VRDRDHLRTLGETLEDPADRVRCLAADAGIDLADASPERVRELWESAGPAAQ